MKEAHASCSDRQIIGHGRYVSLIGGPGDLLGERMELVSRPRGPPPPPPRLDQILSSRKER